MYQVSIPPRSDFNLTSGALASKAAWFQSLQGLILTVFTLSPSTLQGGVSIPLRSDFNAMPFCAIIHSLTFQSLQGLILTTFVGSLDDMSYLVSIPPRSDFNGVLRVESVPHSQRFNPSKV